MVKHQLGWPRARSNNALHVNDERAQFPMQCVRSYQHGGAVVREFVRVSLIDEN